MKQPSSYINTTIATVIAGLIIMVTTLYLLWFLVAIPNAQQVFVQHVTASIDDYQKTVSAYLLQKDKRINQLIKETWDTQTFDRDKLSTALTHNMRARGFNFIDLSIITADDISAYSELRAPESFLTVDMLNRLQAKQPIFWEAAKKADTRIWQLNKLFPVVNDNELLAVVFVSLSLESLYSLFSEQRNAGYITISQTLDHGKPLTFFLLGSAEDTLTSKTRTIENSYWQISYRPAQALKQRYQAIPSWFWAVAMVLFFKLTLAVYTVVKKPKTTVKRGSRKTVSSQKSQEPIKQRVANDKEKASEFILSDYIFRAYDIRGIVDEQLSADTFYAIGQAVATEALAAGEQKILVGRDARTHSPELSDRLIDGIISTGCGSIDIGLVPTPLLNFTAIHHADTSSGIIVTASHNAKEYNGCKMVINGNTLVDEDIQGLKQRIQQKDVISTPIKGEKSTADYAQAYIDRIANDLAIVDGWKVVVDTANGAASKLAIELFSRLKCQLTPLFCEFDGTFPNHDPDPSVAVNLQSLIDKVKEEKSDAGFAFDGDGDRLVVITSQGDIIWPDQLMMLFVQDIVARNPGCDVVYDIKSSACLCELIAQHGGRPVMWKTGHSHIKAKMRETGALLGGEFSGHIFFKERWFGFDDGLYAAARLLEIMTLTGKTLDNLLAALPKRVSTPEIKVAIDESQKFAFMKKLMNDESLRQSGGDVTAIDGVRIDYEHSWGLVRASNTAPALTLRFEADNESQLEVVKNTFKQLIKNIDKSLSLDF